MVIKLLLINKHLIKKYKINNLLLMMYSHLLSMYHQDKEKQKMLMLDVLSIKELWIKFIILN